MDDGLVGLNRAAGAFMGRMEAIKAGLTRGGAGFDWYPYGTLTSYVHLERLLTGQNRGLFDRGSLKILDVGCQDGDTSFFLESLGHRVTALDYPDYNYNGMRGVETLKKKLGSGIELRQVDLDRQFELSGERYDLAVMLGVLYHLRNPFYVLTELARRASVCLLSTRIARQFPDGTAAPEKLALAYLLGDDELNNDTTNYFIFSEAGLHTLLRRSGWEICDYLTVGNQAASDPVHPERDERAFCFLRSLRRDLTNLVLLEGWHEDEGAGWRWTERNFAVRLLLAPEHGPRTLAVDFFFPESLFGANGAQTVRASVNGQPLAPAEYSAPGRAAYRRQLPAGLGKEITLRFELSACLPADSVDERERAAVVSSVELM